MQKHNEPQTCVVCGKNDIKLMSVHLEKWCPGAPVEQEPHIEVDLREWEDRERRIQDLEAMVAERDAKIASMSRTAARKNTQIRNLKKQVHKQ